MAKRKRIMIAAERSSAYGRNFICGVAEDAEQNPEWDLELINPESATAKADDEYDGWICRVTDRRMAKALAKSARPVVDCLCAVDMPEFATVKTDAEKIGELAAQHFLERHFVNFAFCGYRRVAFSDRRRNAFAESLKQHSFQPSIYRPPLRPSHRFGRDFLLGDRTESPPDADDLAAWLKRLPKPVGVFCCDDLRASQLAALCRTLKLSVPDDVAILGVDDDPIYCMFSTPRLSSIDPDSVAIGRTAAQALSDMLADRNVAVHPPNMTVPPKGVVKRTSTDTYPDAPPWFAEAMFFIRRNVAKGISASDVFRHVGYSRTLVERAFREHISSSVQRKIAEARIDEAMRLLSSTHLPVKEIASLSGFSTLEYLTHAFTAATGLSPTAWREQNRNA
jgi:LacI family transcriptional regulator